MSSVPHWAMVGANRIRTRAGEVRLPSSVRFDKNGANVELFDKKYQKSREIFRQKFKKGLGFLKNGAIIKMVHYRGSSVEVKFVNGRILTMKRILATVLCLALLLSQMAIMATAQGQPQILYIEDDAALSMQTPLGKSGTVTHYAPSMPKLTPGVAKAETINSLSIFATSGRSIKLFL